VSVVVLNNTQVLVLRGNRLRKLIDTPDAEEAKHKAAAAAAAAAAASAAATAAAIANANKHSTLKKRWNGE
jgi:ribosomal protein L12E/L44/L45/RPP1/RPP2